MREHDVINMSTKLGIEIWFMYACSK